MDASSATPHPEPKTPGPFTDRGQASHKNGSGRLHRDGPGLFRVVLGLFIALIGLSLLANQMGWHWNLSGQLLRLWPVLIILAGLSLMGGRGVIGRIAALVVVIAVLFFVVSLFVWQVVPFSNDVTQSSITVPLDPSAQSAHVALKLGAAKLSVSGGSDNLVSGSYRSGFSTLSTSSTVSGGVQSATLSNVSGITWWQGPFGRGRTEADIRLSAKMPVALAIDGGALDATMDLTDVQATELTVAAGASTLNLSLGDLVTASTVTVNAGATALDISLPSTVGVRLTLESGATSKSIERLSRVGGDTYESGNFATAQKKIFLMLKLGASTLKVGWRE